MRQRWSPPSIKHTGRKRRRGQPSRQEYLAAEVAYMWDIERLPLRGENGTLDLCDYLAVRIKGYPNATDLALELVTYASNRHRSKTIERWIREGRRVLQKEGAWPWALVPEGKIPRGWWRDPRFEEALLAWRTSCDH